MARKKAIKNIQPNTQITIYETDDGKARVEVRFEDENVWLTQKLMAELFDCSIDNVSLHLKNIFSEHELDPYSVTEEYSITATDGKRYKTKHYNLEVIIAVGFRVNSVRGTQFRQWATEHLKEYMVKGFTLDDIRLKQGGRELDKNYISDFDKEVEKLLKKGKK